MQTPVAPSAIEPSGPVEKIGAAKHPGRNALILGSLVVGAAVIGGYYAYMKRADGPKLAALADFRKAYADKCDLAEFRGPTQDYVAHEYLESDILQKVVAERYAGLATASCKDTDQALRNVGFPTSARPQ